VIALPGAFGPAQLSEEEQGSFFQAALERSLVAEAKAGTIERHFSLAGYVICLRFAGEALAQCFTPALAHLAVPATGRPDAVFHIWDSQSTGIEMIPPPCPHGCFTSRGDIWTMGSQRFRSAYLWSEYALNLFDSVSATGVYWTQGSSPLPYWAKASPLRCLLHWWAETRSCQLLHAAAVGSGGAAVLITGKGGLGKSTTALACLDKGMHYLGDDYVLVRLDPVASVHSLYCTAKLNWDQATRFPRFAGLIAGPDMAGTEKAVLYLHPAMRERITESLPLRLVVTPRIAGLPQTETEAISGLALQQAAAFTTLAQLPRASGRTHDFIDRLVDRLPGLQLALGQDLDGIAEAIIRLLEGPARQTAPKAVNTGWIARPLVSVIIPARNAAPRLQDTLASVLAQKYPAIEIIVVDDGSNDEIGAAVRALPVEVRFLKQAHRGPAAARNRGIRECSGDLITFLDAGNLWPVGSLHAMIDLMASDRNCDIVRGVGRPMDPVGNQGHTEHGPSPKESPSPALAGALYRRGVFERIGLFDRTSSLGEDSAWFNRARGQGLKLRQLEHVTLQIRPADQIQGSEASPQEANALRALKDALNRQRNAGRPPTG
jgi:Glycosyl transferase family 2